MKKISKKKLDKIIARHQHWLNKDCKGWETMKADLSRKDLSGENLSGANLSYANLSGADLSNADLRYSNVSGADLSNADLRYSDVSGADLTSADLRYSDVSGADLTSANLSRVDLTSANLSHVDLTSANLANALMNENTVLDGVRYNETTAFFKPCCPEEGSFVAFKKAYMYNNDLDKVIVKLQVPATAQRSSATSRKCRVSEAKVVSITSLDGKKSFKKARAYYDKLFIYEVGKTMKVKDFDPCRWHECAPGIHCFITREEAVQY